MRDRARMNAICAFYENAKLDQNDHKGDWKSLGIEELWNNIVEEYDETHAEMMSCNWELAKYELADMINTCKMALEKVHDICQDGTKANRVRANK